MKLFAFLFAMALIGLSGCEPSTGPVHEAERLSLAQLASTPGFDWFTYEFEQYTPDQAVVGAISGSFDSTQHKVLAYVNPSCSCQGTQKLFPQFMRILSDSRVPESRYEIYSMYKPGENHPYANRFAVSQLPHFVVLKGDSIVATINEFPADTRLENAVLEILQR